MKIKLAILLFLICNIITGTNYYFKNAGNDSNTGLSDAQAWQTITKFNSYFSSLSPGDSILFKKGDTWIGTLVISRSGTAGNDIVISHYSTGDNPKITGLVILTSWTDETGGIYSKVVSCEENPNMVIFDGINTPMGRYPNTDYLTIDSHVGETQITGSTLPASPDWDGAEIVIRKYRWILDRNLITDHTNHTVVYVNGSDYPPQNGYGFFIQNDLETLDVLGEWYYDGTKLYMFFGSENPTNHVINVSTIETLVSINDENYITFEGINFYGANYRIFSLYGQYITIKNCGIYFCGNDAIYADESTYLTILNNTITDINNNGIKTNPGSTNATISYNTLTNIGIIPGMSGNGDDMAEGINTKAANNIIDYNSIVNCGFIGVQFRSNNTKVRYNFINNFCIVKNDAGGLYTYNGSGGYTFTGIEVNHNIILNGSTASQSGTGGAAIYVFGIYLDDKSNGITLHGNTCANNPWSGIFLHDNKNITLTDNLFYNNTSTQLASTIDNSISMTGIVMTGNIFISKSSTQRVLDFESNVIPDDIPASFTILSDNYYARPIDDNLTIYTDPGDAGETARTLTSWQTYTGQDLNSHKSPVAIITTNELQFEFNNTNIDKTINLNYAKIDIRGIEYATSYTISPYSSVVLLPDPDPENPEEPEPIPTYTYFIKHNGHFVRSNKFLIIKK